MRTVRVAAPILVAAAACGGGERRAETTPSTPGPVTHPDRDPPVGTLVHDRSAPVRAVTMSSLPPEGSGFTGDDDPLYRSHASGPTFTSEPLPAVTEQPPAQGCDAEPFVTQGRDALSMGQPAQALAAFEKALVCVHDPKVESLAVMAACQAKIYSRARAHFVRVDPAARDRLIQICHGPYFIARGSS
jgi:hypothetical protein